MRKEIIIFIIIAILMFTKPFECEASYNTGYVKSKYKPIISNPPHYPPPQKIIPPVLKNTVKQGFQDTSNHIQPTLTPLKNTYQYTFQAQGFLKNVTLTRPPYLDAASSEVFTACTEALDNLQKSWHSMNYDIKDVLPKILAALDNYFVGTRYNREIRQTVETITKYHSSLDQFSPALGGPVSMNSHFPPQWIKILPSSSRASSADALTPKGYQQLTLWGFPANHTMSNKHMFRPFYEIPLKPNKLSFFIPAFGYTPTSQDNPHLDQIRFEPNIHMEQLISDFTSLYAKNPKLGFTLEELPDVVARMYRDLGRIFMEEVRRLKELNAQPIQWKKLFDAMMKTGCSDEYLKALLDYRVNIGVSGNIAFDNAVSGLIIRDIVNTLIPNVQNLIADRLQTSSLRSVINGKADYSRMTDQELARILAPAIKNQIDVALASSYQAVPPKDYALMIGIALGLD